MANDQTGPRRPLASAILRAALALCLWVAAGAPGLASTLLPAGDVPGYVHEVFSAADGLPAAGINQVLQGRDGYLWLATFDGLVRFDGARFEVFDSERVPALSSDRIARIHESRDGTLWVLSEGGHLVRFSHGAFTACGEPRAGRGSCTLDEPGPGFAQQLFEDRGGTLWVGGRSGLYRLAGDELLEVPLPEAAPSVYAVFVDRSGALWVGTRRALWTGRPGRFVRVAVPPAHWGRGPHSLAESADGAVWVATDIAAGSVVRRRFTPVFAGWSFLAQGVPGEVWIAVAGRLLRTRGGPPETVVADQPGWPGLSSERSLHRGLHGEVWTAWAHQLFRDGVRLLARPPSASFTAVAVDRGGTVWATTWSGELHALHPVRLAAFSEGLPAPGGVSSLYEDTDGTLWAGGTGLLAALAPGAHRFRPVAKLDNGTQGIQALLRDRFGRLLVGSRGLHVLAGGRLAGPVGPPSLQTAHLCALFEDSQGALWVGTSEGLYHRGPAGGWRRYRVADGLPHGWVRAFHQTRDGALWLGTNGGGVARFADGRFTVVDRARGLASDAVRAFYEAPDGGLWIAGESRGLSRLDPRDFAAPALPGAPGDRDGGPRIAVVGERQGLYAGGVHKIVADGLGNLWMSSNQGVFRVRLRDLNAVAAGTLPRLASVAYTERDGMPSREANGGVQDAGLRDRRGRIWFPTQKGVVGFDPRPLLARRPPPPVHLTHLRAGGREVPLAAGGTVRLGPSQRSFAVAFTAPELRAPERLRFRYRLRPYDRDWLDAGRQREAFYTKVPPGTYRFEVQAMGPDGERAAPAAVGLEIVPRFHETAWFLLVAGLAAAAAVGGAVRLWVARQRARQRALERLVAERTATIAAQSEKLQELDRLKSQFFANVSHELRTPLTLTLGPLDDALAGGFGPLSGELADQLGVASRNARRLLGLVDQLLDVARLDAGRLRLRPRQVDLAAHLRERVESFLPLAERRGIDLALTVPTGPVTVAADEGQLEKVFDNLLGNALKFTPAGGTVRVRLDPEAEEGRVAVEVRDDGPGIPAGHLEQVFDRFHQVEGTAARGWPGAGIGLALARQLAELHGGTVSVASEEGAGACFTVVLPAGGALSGEEGSEEPAAGSAVRPRPAEPAAALDEAREPAAEPVADDPDDARAMVLVVDDNAEVRAYVRRHLEPGYRVVEAGDGREGLDRARRLLPDLVVSDVMMPGLDGNALFRALRDDPELELVPVVLLTAKASPESRVQGLREGVDDYLVKPFDPRELRARVDNLLASRKRLLARVELPPRPLRPIRATAVAVTSADEAFLARVQALVEERLGDPDLSVEALAGLLGCDRSYLLRKLRALTGEPPSGLIRTLRLQRAEQLLQAGAGAVSEIAYAVGFKSVAHFSNSFQERYGERPSAFAARHRNSG